MSASGEHDERLGSVESSLDAVLARPPAERATALEDSCRRHPDQAPALRARFDALIRFGLIDPATPVGELGPGAHFGPYEIVRRLASGGMGTVFLARQLEPVDREVALKLIRTDRALDDKMRERFAREVRALARFDHPLSCAIYDAGVIDGRPYLAMRYVEGESLAALVDKARRAPDRPGILAGTTSTTGVADSGRTRAGLTAPIANVVALFERIARGVAALHGAGFAHRDLKPGNIFIDLRGDPVILDLGLSKGLRDVLADSGTLTLSGAPIGTPAYMAPEQVRGAHDADATVDVYGLGATLFECLALRPPFERTDREALFLDILALTPPDLRALCRGVPRDLAVVVAKTLEKDPRRRYDSAAALADDLARVLAGRPVLARPAGPLRRIAAWRRERPGTAHTLIALAILLLSSFAFAWERSYQVRVSRALAGARESAMLLGRDQARAREVAERAFGQLPCHITLSQLWNARAADCLVRSLDLDGSVTGCAWSSDGRRLLCLTVDGSFELLDREGSRVIPRVRLVPESPPDFLQPSISGAWQGDQFAVASREGLLTIRDRDGAAIRQRPLPATTMAYLLLCRKTPGIAWSPPGRAAQLAVALQDWDTKEGRVVLVDAAGTTLADFPLGRTRLTSLHWRPHHDQLLTTGGDRHASLWSLDGQRLRDFSTEIDAKGFTAARFFADGKRLALGANDGRMFVIDLDGGTCTRLDGLRDVVIAIAVAPDGDRVAASAVDQRALLWQPDDGTAIAQLSHLDAVSFDLEFSPDGRWLALADATGRISIHDREGLEVRTLRGHASTVTDVEFAADGLLASTSYDRSVRLWRLAGGDYRAIPGHRNRVAAAQWVDQRIVSVGHDGRLQVYDVAEDRGEAVDAGHGRLWSIGIAHGGGQCASGSHDGSVRLWSLPAAGAGSPEPLGFLGEPRAHTAIVHSICYTKDDRFIITTSTDGTTKIWSTASSSVPVVEVLEETKYDVMMAAVDSASSTLATVRVNGEVGLYRIDLEAGSYRRLWAQPLRFATNARSVEFGPDEQTLLIGLDDGTARLHDLARVPRTRYGAGDVAHAGSVVRATFSPDGSTVLTGSQDGTVRLWSADGTPIVTLEHGAPVHTCGFSPDSRRLFAAGEDRVIRIWPAPKKEK